MPEVITTRNKPRRNTVRDLLQEPNCVRAYRYSPESIMLQLRREKDYTGVCLTFDEAWQLVDALLDALPLDRKEG